MRRNARYAISLWTLIDDVCLYAPIWLHKTGSIRHWSENACVHVFGGGGCYREWWDQLFKRESKGVWDHLWWEIDKWWFLFCLWFVFECLIECVTAKLWGFVSGGEGICVRTNIFKPLTSNNQEVSGQFLCCDRSCLGGQLTRCPIHVRDSWSIRVNCYNRIHCVTHKTLGPSHNLANV